MARMSRMVGAVVGSMALAAVPTAKAEAIPETEPNNTFPGQAATVGTQFDGFLCPTCVASPSFPFFPDSIDFFHYTGLTPGDDFDLTFQATGQLSGNTLQAGLYSDQTTIDDAVTASSSTAHLLGTVPASGELTFGITEQTASGFEIYNILLTTTPGTRVPEPATAVLLAAGLTAAGLTAARRKQRT